MVATRGEVDDGVRIQVPRSTLPLFSNMSQSG